MPAVPSPIAPSSPNTYPEYGVGGGQFGSSEGWNIVVASNASQKMTYASKGYLVWFNSRAAAQKWLSAEESPYGSGEPQSAVTNPLDAIGDFFHRLTEAATWERVGEVTLGAILIYAGVKAVTSGTAAGAAVKSAKKTAGKVTDLIPQKKAVKVAKTATDHVPRPGRTTPPPPSRPSAPKPRPKVKAS